MENKINIYKITDRTNGKIYIGQTKRNIYRRFADHTSRINSNREERFILLSIYCNEKSRNKKFLY